MHNVQSNNWTFLIKENCKKLLLSNLVFFFVHLKQQIIFCDSEAFDLRHEIRESSSHAEAEEFAQNGDEVCFHINQTIQTSQLFISIEYKHPGISFVAIILHQL